MATAPRPGVGRRKQQANNARQVARMRVGDEWRTLAVGSIPFQERAMVRKATGLPIESFLGGETSIGLDSLQVLWWLAGRANDPFLTLDRMLEDWPESLGPDDFEVEMVEGDDDSPEA